MVLSLAVIYTVATSVDMSSVRAQFKNMRLANSAAAIWVSDIFNTASLPPIKFDFYEQEMIPESQSYASLDVATFQTGAFSSKEDAERMTAKLSASQIVSRIEMVPIDGTGVLHRVLVGPLKGDATIISTRIKILDTGIVPILIRTSVSPHTVVD